MVRDCENFVQKRRRLENFVLEVFRNWHSGKDNKLNKMLNDLVKNQDVSYMVIQNFVNVDRTTFITTFNDLASQVLKKCPEMKYVIVLIGLTIILDEHMRSKSWYSPKTIFNLLVEALQESNFIPENPYKNLGLVMSAFFLIFLVIVI